MKPNPFSSSPVVSNILLAALAIVAILNLIAEAADIQWLIWLSKPLLMPLLCAYLWRQTASHPTRFRLLYALGLFFSFCGDVLLMLATSEQLFLLGLISFLCTHLCYIFANTGILHRLTSGYLFSNRWASLPFIAFWLTLMALLWQGIPPTLKIAVGLYSLVITAMCLSTIHLKKRMPPAMFYALAGGAVLFMFSDSLIALSKFRLHADGPVMRLAIMSTYILGQYLIIKAAAQLNSLIPFRDYEVSKQK